MKYEVTYEDGTTEKYKVKPRHLVDYEDEFGSFAETAKSAYALAHFASDSPLAFRDWLNTVDDITPVREAGDPAVVAGSVVADGEEATEPVPTE
jgi:hypothetical protein